MADVNHIISLGVGDPAGIQEFLTFGLQQSTANLSSDFTRLTPIRTFERHAKEALHRRTPIRTFER